MTLDLDWLRNVSEEELARRAVEDPEWVQAQIDEFLQGAQHDRQSVQLAYYRPTNPMAWPIHQSTAKEIVAAGGNRCLPLSAPVLMADATWKALEDIAVGDRVIGVDPITRRGRPATVTHVHRSGVKPVRRITFSDGGSFEATDDHEVPLLLNPGRNTSKGYPQRPRKRRLGDYLHRLSPRADKRLSALSPSHIRYTPAAPSLPPYVLGALLGDGCFMGRSLRFSCGDAGVLRRFERDLRARWPAVDVRHDVGPNYRIVAGRPHPVTHVLRALGLWGCDSRKKFIPAEAFRYPRSERLAFIAGLVDTDGADASYCSVSRDLATGFAALIRSVGGKSTLTEHVNQFGMVYMVYWRMSEPLPIEKPHKQRPDSTRAVDWSRRIIRRVADVGEKPCGDITVDHPGHCYVTGDYVIVSNSGKTETMLVELAIALTGHVPMALAATYPMEKVHPPIRARLVCDPNVLEAVIKSKLRWDQWHGIGEPGSGFGHYGWIPRHCLVGGSWDKAWSEKHRTLSVATDTMWRGPQGERRRSGVSTVQIMTYEQDISAFAGQSLHWVGHDELPRADVYRENRIRTLDVRGRLYTAFTPPDEIGVSRADVAWFYDEVYERGLPGPGKAPHIDAFTLHTEKNAALPPEEIHTVAAGLTDAQREVRLLGRFIHLTGVIFPDFTAGGSWWCFRCAKKIVIPAHGTCPSCTGSDIVEYQHVVPPFDPPATWPVVMVVDPHPRKPDAIGWFAVTPRDDYVMLGEIEQGGTAQDVAKAVEDYERTHRIRVVKRLMDPNMATETNDKLKRGWTLRKEYDDAGLRCDLANDEMHAGINAVRAALRPDSATRAPRLTFQSQCTRTTHAMARWAWDEYQRQGDREPKEHPRDKHKDFVDLVRYFLMDRPSFYHYQMRDASRRTSARSRRGY